jgi:hypothetical protein
MDQQARDLRTALNVTAGPEAPTANGYSWTLSQPRHARLADFRVGVVLDHEVRPVRRREGMVERFVRLDEDAQGERRGAGGQEQDDREDDGLEPPPA